MASTAPITPNPYSSASLYVGDLAPDVTEAIIFDTFNAVGPVASVRVCRDAATRRSLGYAYVNFHRVEDADRALETMNFKNIRGRPCRIMWSHRDPSLRKSGVGNIFVNHLAPSIDNKTLYDTFSMFGNILSCKVINDKNGKSLGYGFVHYESQEAAEGAIKRVNDKVIGNHKVSVTAFKPKKERPGPKNEFTNVFVKNLPLDMEEEKLRELFAKHGEISSLKLGPVPEKKTKNMSRYGFVDFKTSEEAKAAIAALNDLELGEKKLFVGRFQKKADRERELRSKHEAARRERQKQYRGFNLYVKNLADSVDDAKLIEEFSKFGSITSAKVMVDRVTKKTKGFGFVCFSASEEATKAVAEMNGRMLESKPLYVALAQRKEERRAQLEAQYASRAKFGAQGGPQMYPQGPVFYPGGMQPGRPPVMYPQQMVPGRWGMQQRPPMMQGGVPARMNYQLMPAMVGGMQQQQRGGGRGRQQRGKMQQQMDPRRQAGAEVRYSNQVRNQQQQQQQLAGRQPGAAGGAQPRQAPQQRAQPASTATATPSEPLVPSLVKKLAALPDDEKKQLIGEQLFPLVEARQPLKAGKITGMLLEMDNGELIHLLESSKALDDNIKEALAVLDRDEEESDEDEESDEEDEEA